MSPMPPGNSHGKARQKIAGEVLIADNGSSDGSQEIATNSGAQVVPIPERGVSTTYLGNYSAYLQQKYEQQSAQLSAYERQQKELEKQQAFVDRFRASATRSTQAKSREKQLEKVEKIEAPIADVRTLKFQFPPAVRSGREVVTIKNIVHIYDDKILFLGANLEILSLSR